MHLLPGQKVEGRDKKTVLKAVFCSRYDNLKAGGLKTCGLLPEFLVLKNRAHNDLRAGRKTSYPYCASKLVQIGRTSADLCPTDTRPYCLAGKPNKYSAHVTIFARPANIP